MTPLRQRMIECMQFHARHSAQLRSLCRRVRPLLQPQPGKLDAEAIHQYLLYLLNDRKFSPESVNTCSSARRFIYLETLERPWTPEYFPRAKRSYKLPVVLSQDTVT
jgi:hypothetical protein